VQVAPHPAPLFILDAHQLPGQSAQLTEHTLPLPVQQRLRDLIGDAARETDLIEMPGARRAHLVEGDHPGEIARAAHSGGDDRSRYGSQPLSGRNLLQPRIDPDLGSFDDTLSAQRFQKAREAAGSQHAAPAVPTRRPLENLRATK